MSTYTLHMAKGAQEYSAKTLKALKPQIFSPMTLFLSTVCNSCYGG